MAVEGDEAGVTQPTLAPDPLASTPREQPLQQQEERRGREEPVEVRPHHLASSDGAGPATLEVGAERLMAAVSATPAKIATMITTLLGASRASPVSPCPTVQPVAIAGCPTMYCLRDDAPLFEEPAIPDATEPARVSLLAPLDPLIYDRRITAALWNFNYTWEAYTPPRKRVRGHYALPVLVGLEIVGHVNPRADRGQRKLVVTSRRIRRGHRVAPALREFARWLFPKP